jgi:hypothetical protein
LSRTWSNVGTSVPIASDNVAMAKGLFRMLIVGNTWHGAQDLSPARRREPLTYYHRTGPIGGVMTAWQGLPQRRRVGVIGLGAGSLAA